MIKMIHPLTFNKHIKLLEIIESNDGEIMPDQEELLEEIEGEIAQGIDTINLWRKTNQYERNVVFHAAKEFSLKKLNQLKALDKVILAYAKKLGGRIKTPLTTVSVGHRETLEAIIDDFHAAYAKYPDCATITISEDNSEMKIKLDKKKLAVKQGFTVSTKQSEFLIWRGISGEHDEQTPADA